MSTLRAPAAASPGARPEAFQQARETAQLLLQEGRVDEAFEFMLAALAAVLKTTRELEQLVAQLRRGPRRSERVNAEQLALLMEQLAAVEPPASAAVDRETAAREDAALEQEIEGAERERRAQPAPAARPGLAGARGTGKCRRTSASCIRAQLPPRRARVRAADAP